VMGEVAALAHEVGDDPVHESVVWWSFKKRV
jgi:hypothetical protein